MSLRYPVSNPFNIDISDDGRELEILFDSDEQGNKYVDVPLELVEYAKQKRLIIKFLEWTNKINAKSPMQLETDNDDIATMFLDEYGE